MSNIWDLLSGGVDALDNLIGTATNLPDEASKLWDKLKIPVIVIGSLFIIKELKN